VAEHLLRWLPSPYARARALRLLGARIGRNVRIHEVRFLNLEQGFANLHVEDDVHIGLDCLLDLKGPLHVGRGAVLGPRVVVLTHQDAGSHHGAAVAEVIGTFTGTTDVGPGSFVGVSSTVLCGAHVGAEAVVAAGSVVTEPTPDATVVAGVPARPVRSIAAELAAVRSRPAGRATS
jgi:acetyltransferase-like isoleucine patch superfamily enzyme